MTPTFQRSQCDRGHSETVSEGEWGKQDGATHLYALWEFVRRLDGVIRSKEHSLWMLLLKAYTQEAPGLERINQENSALGRPQITKRHKAGQRVEQGERLQRDMGKDSLVCKACPASTRLLLPLESAACHI